MQIRIRNSVTILVLSALPLGCATDGTARRSESLSGTGWVLADSDGLAVPDQRRATMNFDRDRVSGNDGCNRYSGSYTAKGSAFAIGNDVVSTRMACPEPTMRSANAFIGAIKQASAVKHDGSRLTLLDANGKSLAVMSALPTGLAGSAWRVTAYNNGKQALVSVLAGTELSMSFGPDARLSGSAGCNRYTGSYSTSAKTIQIGKAAATLMACVEPEQVMQQERQFLDALATAATWRRDDDLLELRSAADAMVLTASAVTAR
jgi:heat shock protein HslJ